jgi:hypothetical protein
MVQWSRQSVRDGPYLNVCASLGWNRVASVKIRYMLELQDERDQHLFHWSSPFSEISIVSFHLIDHR